MQEEVCQGHGNEKTWTIGSWIQDQGVTPYDELGEEFKEIALNEFFLKGHSLKPSQMEMLVMVLYDLDKFRRFVFDSSFLERFEVEDEVDGFSHFLAKKAYSLHEHFYHKKEEENRYYSDIVSLLFDVNNFHTLASSF